MRFAALLAFGLMGGAALAQQRSIALPELRSGSSYMSADIKAMQDDSFANPGMLWVEKGATLWQTAPGSAAPAGVAGASAGVAGGPPAPAPVPSNACASCHHDASSSMRGVAARYPVFDAKTKQLLNLEGRINQCRSQRQGAAALAYESEELLALTAYVAHQSRGMPMNAVIDRQTRHHFEAGRAMYYRRIGQMNLSCAQCHQENWGKKLGPETISQGHSVAYPIYRLEWQTTGSLHRRFRSCLSGIRAELLPQGAPEFLDLELYLAWRAGTLPIETPGVRR